MIRIVIPIFIAILATSLLVELRAQEVIPAPIPLPLPPGGPAPGVPQVQGRASFNDVARFVSGQPQGAGSPLRALEGYPSVRRHYTESADLAKTWKERRLNQIRDWARAEIHPRISRPQVVKYPFSGPDFVHVVTLFPGSNDYVLAGLEPLGTVPDFQAMDEAQLGGYLTRLNHSLRSISQRNFFITIEMREDFGVQGIDGVYTALLYFAALTDHQVRGGRYVRLDATGAVVEASANDAEGIHLQLHALDRLPDFPEISNLYYFKTDLSNGGFKAESPFKHFLDARPGGMGYLKAASYLMHQEGFSNIRNFLVGGCDYILQDESGIPAEFFATYYDVSYYGRYAGPIDMFKEFNQPYLHQVYSSGVARPLPFGTGYRMRDEDSIQMFGIRKR